MGAWIETRLIRYLVPCALSHPSWVRGLKLPISYLAIAITVAPLVGAWIETFHSLMQLSCSDKVAPLVGAWIETLISVLGITDFAVAPLVGAWIET